MGTRSYLRFHEKEDRSRRLAGQLLTFIAITLGVYYLFWHWSRINWDCWYFSFPFFLAETVGLLLFCYFSTNAWFLRYHSPDGVPAEQSFSVDIFITVAGEPVGMLSETVQAAQQICYDNKQVYILDDTGDARYRELAETTGCSYFARPDHIDAKAGNLNYAFTRTRGDLILTLDADQIPQSNIVSTLIGYFTFPKIAFVQSKQDFKVPVGDPFGNTDRIFYSVMQSGKDNDNSAFSCGSGVMYRRTALEEIGGFSTWNLVEDVHTSMLLHECGWRSIYYNYPLTQGTAPTDIYSIYRQRRQWAADSLRILFWDNPFLRKGLKFKQKLQYFHLGVVYLVAAFVMPVFFLTPILSILSEINILNAPVRHYVLHRFPYFLAMTLAYGIINYPTPYMRAFQIWTGLFPAFIHATWIALRHKSTKPPYRVNVKPSGVIHPKNPWLAVLPQIAIMVLGPAMIIYGFIAGRMPWDFYLLNVLWILWSLWALSGICSAALRKHAWPKPGEPALLAPTSFFARTRELAITVALTIIFTLFFATLDTSRVNGFFDKLRRQVLASEAVEAPVSSSVPATMQTPEAPLPREASSPSPMASGGWTVQVASMQDPSRAAVLQNQLSEAGFPTRSVPARISGADWIRIEVSSFASEDEAKAAGERIKATGIASEACCWIKKTSGEPGKSTQ